MVAFDTCERFHDGRDDDRDDDRDDALGRLLPLYQRC